MKLKQLIQKDDAVSPVIGVILMVAITVILAAVIATFVLGLGDSIQGSATAGVTVDSNDAVTITSLGANTRGIYCSDGSGGLTDAGDDDVVGDTISCSSGDNVIAEGSGDTKNATIKTDI